jgi:multicomponent Na+:H+ antiporter subunit B
MIWQIEILLFAMLFVTAIIALEVRDLLAAAVTTSVFSFIIAVLFIGMGAVDVGFTEAVVGAGVVGVYFIAFVLRTTRRTLD